MRGYRLLSLGLLSCTCSVASVSAGAQERPDFSGVWTTNLGKSPGTSQSYSETWQLEIDQDENRLSLTETRGPLEEHFEYLLDGSQSFNSTRTVTGERWTYSSEAEWIADAVVIRNTTTRANGGSWDSLITYSLDPEGRLRLTLLAGDIRGGHVMGLETILWTKEI